MAFRILVQQWLADLFPTLSSIINYNKQPQFCEYLFGNVNANNLISKTYLLNPLYQAATNIPFAVTSTGMQSI